MTTVHYWLNFGAIKRQMLMQPAAGLLVCPSEREIGNVLTLRKSGRLLHPVHTNSARCTLSHSMSNGPTQSPCD